ncbi:sensor histidine kinase [Benzoatithermus flavus]|uniref:histidine kinase n=1 Tax=Benzoatithermus flavus TaxID=3108223 RepID=A0ABU8XRQ9_9PROT
MPPRPAVGRISLVAWFLILSLISVAAVSFTSAWLLQRFMSERMLALDVKVTTEFINHVFGIEDADRYFAAARAGEPADELARFFVHVGQMPDVLRANIYRLDHTVVWSTAPSLIGRRFARNEELEEAARGEPIFAFGIAGEEDAKDEHVDFVEPGRPYVENYIPIFRGGKSRGEVVGVVEIYRSPHALFEAIRSGQRLIFTNAALGAFLIVTALIWLVRRADRVMRAQAKAIAEGQRLVTAGEMAAAVAHSLRNPLASIRSSAELAARLRSPERVQALLDDIMAQSDRLAQWVRQYLSADPPETGNKGADLRQVLASVRANNATELERHGIAWHESPAATVPAVAIPPGALEQVLNGLVTNAIHAMPEGGSITIALRPVGRSAVELVIADTGCGMSGEQLARAFTPFVTSKPSGLGLGLALARRIVERHGGRITLESVPAAGTSAILLLPVAR